MPKLAGVDLSMSKCVIAYRAGSDVRFCKIAGVSGKLWDVDDVVRYATRMYETLRSLRVETAYVDYAKQMISWQPSKHHAAALFGVATALQTCAQLGEQMSVYYVAPAALRQALGLSSRAGKLEVHQHFASFYGADFDEKDAEILLLYGESLGLAGH
jgi:hypothetical protein